jgi:hypothetical protein
VKGRNVACGEARQGNRMQRRLTSATVRRDPIYLLAVEILSVATAHPKHEVLQAEALEALLLRTLSMVPADARLAGAHGPLSEGA